ncbi:protein of unknown function DUF1566 [Kipferlia bialata]|uniref:Lcl C-terminal domain-containing protein n=1 Tax=Kipferlia bialata TaxID=797122 RepID=A0A9K3CWL6_9EUKA|nr:protein of unknown function DUF1566 [Kipferlia bialata]|eukprot:g6131.t1
MMSGPQERDIGIVVVEPVDRQEPDRNSVTGKRGLSRTAVVALCVGGAVVLLGAGALIYYLFFQPEYDIVPCEDVNLSYPYTMVDTEQRLCYDEDGVEITAPSESDEYYGQDAQYTGVGASYHDNLDGTVTDMSTGLMWEQSPPSDTVSFDGAADYCTDLDLGGYDDWRVPSLKALFSISLFETGWPFIDEDYFTLVDVREEKSQQYWSDQFYNAGTTHGGQDSAFGVNHGTGHIKAYPDGSDGGDIAWKYCRCVRGNGDYGVNDFTLDPSASTVSDASTNIMWTSTDSGATGLDWSDALSHCSSLSHGGYDDWRLPNVKELHSIVDYSGVYPAIDTSLFEVSDPTALCLYYWTSTSAYMSPTDTVMYYAWYVAFGYAVDDNGDDTHGAGAVRFDTKYAGGPSAEEEENVYNYVRCCRDMDTTV